MCILLGLLNENIVCVFNQTIFVHKWRNILWNGAFNSVLLWFVTIKITDKFETFSIIGYFMFMRGRWRKTKIFEEYCWAMTQAARQPSCRLSGSSVLEFGFQLVCLLYTHTHMQLTISVISSTCSKFNFPDFPTRNYGVSAGVSVNLFICYNFGETYPKFCMFFVPYIVIRTCIIV
jgi:hypothetical protein